MGTVTYRTGRGLSVWVCTLVFRYTGKTIQNFFGRIAIDFLDHHVRPERTTEVGFFMSAWRPCSIFHPAADDFFLGNSNVHLARGNILLDGLLRVHSALYPWV
jgi:hypothetical protein